VSNFQSFSTDFQEIVTIYLSDSIFHAKWINTLSYLENCGARKIARSQHPKNVSRQMLKHAAEEFRHAFYLKQQITTKLNLFLPFYHLDMMWGGIDTLRYLDRLEMIVCRLLNASHAPQSAYFLITYAIEMRASEVYPLYQNLLTQMGSSVSVRSILLEEKGHLEEMQEQIAHFGIEKSIISSLYQAEADLCQKWLRKLKQNVLIINR